MQMCATRRLAPAAAEGTLRAKESVPIPDALPTEGIADAMQFLDLPPDVVKAAEKAEAAEAAAVAARPAKGAPAPAAPAAPAATDKKDDKTAATEKTPETPAKPEFNADQQAWLDLRAKASTPEEVAELDKDIPEFSTEQADWINAQAEAAEAEAAKPAETPLPEFTPEQKPFVDGLQTELATAKATVADQSKRLEELTAQVGALEQRPPVVTAGINPVLIAPDGAAIDRYVATVRGFIDWADKHPEGSEELKNEKGEVTQPAYSAEQIATRKAYWSKQLMEGGLVPIARDLLKGRQAQDVQAHTAYPQLAKADSADAKTAAGVLANYPMLRAIPNVLLIIGDALEGERLRLAKANRKAPTVPLLRIKPKGPVRGTAAGKPVVAPRPAPTGEKAPDLDKFLAGKSTATSELEALTEAMS